MKLKRELKDNQKEAVKFITDCFDDMLEDNGFITWLANGTGYKPNRLKKNLKENKTNKRNSKFAAVNFQEIYDFWLDNSINSNKSVYDMKRITKLFFLEQFLNITDSNVIEKRVQLRKRSKVVFTAPRMVYTETIRKLHSRFNQKHTNVSLSLFFRYKPYYCVRPTEKERLSCLYLNWLSLKLIFK